MIKAGLTRRQHDCLQFIEEFTAKHSISPSYYEIMLELGLKSKSGVYRLIHALEERGYISLLRGRARAIACLSDRGVSSVVVELGDAHFGDLKRLSSMTRVDIHATAADLLRLAIDRRIAAVESLIRAQAEAQP